ncbi:MAG: hypothetical protein AB7P02_17200, partial [Alphaproteobacteria bacterium]
MKASIHVLPAPRAPHQRLHCDALAHGLLRHGVDVVEGRWNEPATACDLAIVWGWKQPALTAAVIARGGHVLMLERGYVQPRMDWASLAVDGLEGAGRFLPAPDGGARWDRHFGHHLRPWRRNFELPHLLLGQVPGDAALAGLDFDAWAAAVVRRLHGDGHVVLWRAHPVAVQRGRARVPPNSIEIDGTLDAALDMAGAVVTHSSMAAVEAVLAGVPAIALG